MIIIMYLLNKWFANVVDADGEDDFVWELDNDFS